MLKNFGRRHDFQKISRLAVLLLTLSAGVPVLASDDLRWQAAYQLRDSRAALEIVENMLKTDPNSAQTLCYKMQSLCLAGSPEEALKVWTDKANQINLPEHSDAVSKALSDLAWSFLRQQLQSASPEVWLFVCSQMQNIHERQVSELVCLALQHSDLRVQLSALDLVASYPQDVYRQQIQHLWMPMAHPLLRARILEIASELGWPEAEQMANDLMKNPQLSRMELVALAQYQMLVHRFDPELICKMVDSQDILNQRLGAWLLRFCPVHLTLITRYEKLLGSYDALTLQLTLDSLATSHLSLVPSLDEVLQVLGQRSSTSIKLQVQWLVALAQSGSATWPIWWSYAQKCIASQGTDASDVWQLSQLTSWLVSQACHQPEILQSAWKDYVNYPDSCRLQLAQGIIFTRQKQPQLIVQQAAQVIDDWLHSPSDLWVQETAWLSQQALADRPPAWMPSILVHTQLQELRWQMLELLSLVNPKSSFDLAWQMSRTMPQQWNLQMLWLAWCLGVEALPESIQDERDMAWLRTVMLSSMEDKKKLMQQWSNSDNWWKERIMDAMIRQSDAADLAFLTKALQTPGSIRVKACCAILQALRQGNRPSSKS